MMHFNTKVNVITLVQAPDNIGGWATSENVSILNMPCRINWSKGNEKFLADKRTHYRDAKLFCRPANLTVKNLIVHDGVHYDIVNISNVDSRNKCLVVDIKRTVNK